MKIDCDTCFYGEPDEGTCPGCMDDNGSWKMRDDALIVWEERKL